MTQCNTLNVKLSYSQLNKLKFGRKDGNEVTLKLSSTVDGDFNAENNFQKTKNSIRYNRSISVIFR